MNVLQLNRIMSNLILHYTNIIAIFIKKIVVKIKNNFAYYSIPASDVPVCMSDKMKEWCKDYEDCGE